MAWCPEAESISVTVNVDETTDISNNPATMASDDGPETRMLKELGDVIPKVHPKSACKGCAMLWY